jgi:hypothetical protein
MSHSHMGKSMPIKESNEMIPFGTSEIIPLVQRAISSVREELADSSYINEALRVLPVGGYRSAIGSFWNAVVDDLRNKIIFRSISLFNKEMNLGREIKTYEDFQNHVNDDQLIEGSYKIGVIGWEALKMLKQAKETRHIFDGHPKSTEPSIIKVLAMMDDCTKYVLHIPFPPQIIDINDYISVMGTAEFDRNAVAIENALGDLPETYKNELANRLYSSYVNPEANTVLRSNIELVMPIMWAVLPKEVKLQIVRRVDQQIGRGNVSCTEQAFAFVAVVKGERYLSITARKYKISPLVEKLASSLDNWREENDVVRALAPYAPYIPSDLLLKYVRSLTETYVGKIGHSSQFSRTDFYADKAALHIPKMFEAFDNKAAMAFIQGIKTSDILKRRIPNPAKLARLRALGNIVLEHVGKNFVEREFLEALTNEESEKVFFELLEKRQKAFSVHKNRK